MKLVVFLLAMILFQPVTAGDGLLHLGAHQDARAHPIDGVKNPVGQNYVDSGQTKAPNAADIESTGVIVKGKLMWMRCAMGQVWTGRSCSGESKSYAWVQAMTLRQSYAGHTDWRLPTRKELLSILCCSSGFVRVDNIYTRCATGFEKPAINLRDFPNTQLDTFWSSTPHADYSGYAWVVAFRTGIDGWLNKDNGNPVRLVRDY